MEALERARQDRQRLYEGLKQARARSADPRRVRILREMYEEACAAVRRLEGRGEPPPRKKSAPLWSDLEGVRWDTAEDSLSRRQQRLSRVMTAALEECTPRQREYLQAYYREGLTLEEIGARFETAASTVSRTLKRGRGRIEKYITAVQRCTGEVWR